KIPNTGSSSKRHIMANTRTYARPKKVKLYNDEGKRLYLNETERNDFLLASYRLPLHERSFCMFLVHTGCRISEARYMRLDDVQVTERIVTIKTLKRRKPHFRDLHISKVLAMTLKAQIANGDPKREYLWSETPRPPPRPTCYRLVKRLMKEIGVKGPRASPKGLRHAFGVYAIMRGIQLHILQKWMGHANIEVTAGYADVMGAEERKLAGRMWK
ncbi:MAG: site-specific integrase, partial [Pseudomonadota bacterium]